MMAEFTTKKRMLLIGAAVAGVAILAGGAYMFLGSKGDKTVSQATSSQQTTTASSDTSETSGPQTYKSTKLNIEFTYPGQWKMKENADKTIITLTSPKTTYAKKDGTSTSGVFTLRLRNGLVSDAAKQNIENAVAMKDSEVIAYDSPTEQQRQYTNIVQGGTGANTTFLIVSGGVAFKAGEAFGSNIDLQGAVYLFAGGYGTDSGDSLAFDAVPKASFEGTAYQQAVAIIKSMKIY